MIIVDKEEILDFPSEQTYGASDFIYDCIYKCGLGDRVDEAFELSRMVIEAYQNIIKTADAYKMEVG